MTPSDATPALRALTVIRAAAGAALLLAPEATLAPLTGVSPDERARLFARALGIRHLLEATVLWRVPSPRAVRLGAAVDAVHAATTLGLFADRRRRRLAAVNCLTASGFAIAGWAVASGTSQPAASLPQTP